MDMNIRGSFAFPEQREDVRYLIVNQTSDRKRDEDLARQIERSDITIHHFEERGLSRSRNRVLEHCETDLLWILDDDVSIVSEFEEIIKTAVEQNREDGAWSFQFGRSLNEPAKTYAVEACTHSLFSLGRVSSVEVVLNMPVIRSLDLRFDESFGLGAKYPTGEEFIFLTDLFKRGKKVSFVPQTICLHPEETSGQQLTKENLRAKKKVFQRVFGVIKGALIYAAFVMRKRKLIQQSRGPAVQAS